MVSSFCLLQTSDLGYDLVFFSLILIRLFAAVAWSLYGLIGSQLGDIDNEFILNQNNQRVSVADFIHQYFGYRYSFLGVVVAIMCGFVLAFWGIVIFAIKKFNFQKR
jgi:hypothetical protein